MRLLDAVVVMNIHRSVYTTILQSVLKWGTMGQVARQAAIDPAILSRFQRPDVMPPSLSVAKAVAKALPLSAAQRVDFLEHVALGYKEHQAIWSSVVEDRDWLRQYALGELLRLHELAAYANAPQQTRTFYTHLLQLGQVLVQAFHQAEMSLAAVEAHILLQDALGVLNRPGEALYHAKMAEEVLARVTDTDSELVFYRVLPGDQMGIERLTEQRISFEDVEVNAIRSEAVSHNLMGLYTEAERISDRALRTIAVKRNPASWLPHLLRDKLSAMSRSKTVSIYDLEQVVQQGYRVQEVQNDPVGLLTMHNALTRGYIMRQQFKQAERLLESEVKRVSMTQNLGQLPQAMLLSRFALLYRAQHNEKAWVHYLTQALSLAHESRLLRLLDQLSKEHGSHPAYADIYRQVVGEDME